MNDFRKALELDENFQRAKEGLERAQKRQKQAQKRDYYKILGVKRNARKKEINKVYRKLAQKWHPDNFQDEDEKKRAEKKFMDIAAAKEVLTDEGGYCFTNGVANVEIKHISHKNKKNYLFILLFDTEMRKKFDNGEDPLDPEEQQRGNNPFQGGQGERFFFRGNPFGGGGFPGGGGGHNFKFHFN